MRDVFLSVAAAGVLMVNASTGCAQVVDLDVAFDQSFTSLSVLGSPRGVQVGLTANRLLGRIGIQVGYRHLTEYRGELTRYCDAFSCTPGPFDQSHVLNTAAVGLTLNAVRTIFVDVNVGFTTSFSKQEQELVNLDTGEETRRNSVGPDMGFGLFGDVRLPSIGFRLHPILYGRYERIGASECVPDGACFGGRHIGSVGLGLAVRLR